MSKMLMKEYITFVYIQAKKYVNLRVVICIVLLHFFL